ncbi:MAG: hypothetical protein IPO21_06865 [Bacteroidales bacterium]|nr:hypothetical protein [Bacteroidales bacterium]
MNFDKNTIVGFVLIAAILVIYGIWQQPSEEEKIAMAQQRDSLIQVQKQLDAQEIIRKNTVQSNDIITSSEEPDSIKQKRIAAKFGSFANSASGEKKYTTIENNLIKITISNLGGKIRSVELKKL